MTTAIELSGQLTEARHENEKLKEKVTTLEKLAESITKRNVLLTERLNNG